MHFFQLFELENVQPFEHFYIISYTTFLDIWIQQEIPFLLMSIWMS